MPLTETEANYADGKVTIKKTLAESDKVAIQLVTKKADKVVADSTLEYTVIKGEEAKATTIDLKADKTTVSFGKEIKFTAEVRDQYNSPFEDTLRWVVNGETQKATGTTFALDEETKAGEYKVQVFSVADSKVQAEMTVTVGAAELGELTLTKKQDAFNNEESIVGYLTANEGAVIVPENVTFEIDAASKDVKPEDIKVKAEKVTEKVDGKEVELIAVKATSTKAGSYKIVAKVDEVKSSPITVETTINPEVADFTVTPVKENEVTVGGKVEKVVTFKNKHGETVVPKADNKEVTIKEVTIKSSNEEIAEATQTTKKVNKDDKENSFVVTFEGKKAGDVTFTFVAGKVAKQVSFEVVKTAGIDSINLGATIGKGLIAGTGQEEFVRPITIKDQYGNDYVPTTKAELDKLQANIVTEAEAVKEKATATLKFYKVDEKTGEIKTQDEAKGAKGVALVLDATSATNTKDESVKVTVSKKAEEGKEAEVLATVNATVQAVSKLKSVTVDAKQTTMTTGGSVEVLVVPVDQYGKVVKGATITLNDTEKKVAIDGDATAVYVDKDGKEASEAPGNTLKGYKVTVKGDAKGETTAEFTAKVGETEAKVKQAFKVDSVGALVETVEVKADKEVVNNSKDGAKATLTATGKDADGNEVQIAEKDLTWSIASVKDANGNEMKVDAEGALSYAEGVKKEDQAIDDLTGKTVTIEDGVLTASKGLTVEVEAQVKTANNKVAKTTVQFNGEKPEFVSGLTVAQVGDTEASELEDKGLVITFGKGEGEIATQTVNLTFSGIDQNGDVYPLGAEDVIEVSSDDETVATATATTSTLTLTAVKEGEAKAYVNFGGETLEIKVIVKEDATVTP